jgi:starvation-inducible DNA-binding protein
MPPANHRTQLTTRSKTMNASVERRTQDPERRQSAALVTPSDLHAAATRDIAACMNGVLADVFALYL